MWTSNNLNDPDVRGVQWVTRAKDNFRDRTVRNLPVKKGGKVVKDQIVKLTGSRWKKLAGWTLRRVEAWGEVNGQVWTALLVSVLLRFAPHIGQWGHSFTRLFAVVRAAMWERFDLVGLLRSYGTAGGSFTLLGSPQTAWLPVFAPAATRSHGTAAA